MDATKTLDLTKTKQKMPKDHLKVVGGSPSDLLKIYANGSPINVATICQFDAISESCPYR